MSHLPIIGGPTGVWREEMGPCFPKKSMLMKRIIPCLDVSDGRVVKGTCFSALRDAGHPVECAKMYDAQGADELALLDVTASRKGGQALVSLIEKVAEVCFVPLTVGGGIRSIEDMRIVLSAGADKVSINTSAVQTPYLVREGAESFGSQCITVAIDARHEPGFGWRVYTHGGSRATALEAIAWARLVEGSGAGEILLTSMDADGTCRGYDCKLTKAVSQAVRIPVIASGGAGELAHLAKVLTEGAADAVLAASIFHFGRYTLQAVKEFLLSKGIAVRHRTE